MSSLKTLMQSKGRSLSETAALSGVDIANLSRAQNLVAPLSLESAGRVGKTLAVEGTRLFAASQVETAQKKVATGQASPGEGLRVVGKVAGILRDRHERGQLEEDRSLEKLLDGMEAVAAKFIDALDDAGELAGLGDEEDDGRDLMGQRVRPLDDVVDELAEDSFCAPVLLGRATLLVPSART